MKPSLRLLLTAIALSISLSILTSCGNNDSSTSADTAGSTTTASSNAQLVQSLDAYRPPASSTVTASPLKPRDLSIAPTPTIVALGAPPASQTTAAQKSTSEDHMGKPMRIGFGRDVAQTATAAATQQVLKWQATASGGQVTAINFSSTGAKALRIGLLVTKLPAAATLRFYAKGATTTFEVKGADVLSVLAKNLAAGDKTDEGRTYWSPAIKANNGTVEIEIPAGLDTSLVQVSVPLVSHLFMSTSDAQAVLAQSTYGSTDSRAGNSGLSCQVDVNCAPPLPAASDAVAWLLFNEGPGFAYICSGTLLNDNLNSRTPYLLTANHCISTQTSASTLHTEFKYRSLTCNNATTGEYFPTSTTGSALLYTAYDTDSSLLQLYGNPSTAVLFAGWDATTLQPLATPTHGVHHPAGDQQRISRGNVNGYYIRNPDQTQIYSFFTSPAATSTFLVVNFTSGIVEGGSSGSGLFKGTESNPQLIGQLFGGSQGTCLIPPLDSTLSNPQRTVYGRFDVAFNAGMKDWLVQGIKSVNLFNNASTGVYYYTYSTADISTLSSNAAYSNQGAYFKVSSYQTAGLSPVHRFYNTSNGSYFYTISEKERAAVASNTPRMRYDGVVWYASATAAAVSGTVPLYSAFNKATGAQFFTTSLTARSSLITANPQFITDGIAFYVAPVTP